MNALITIEHAIGYSGKRGGKVWVAAILGTHLSYGMERDFLDGVATDKDAKFTAIRKRKGIWTEQYDLSPGIYELCQYDVRSFIRVSDAGEVTTITADEANEAAVAMSA